MPMIPAAGAHPAARPRLPTPSGRVPLRLLTALAALLLVAAPTRAQGDDDGVRTFLDGVYTAEQAERGAATFGEICSACHDTSQFGAAFFESWAGAPAFYLYELIRTTMPQDNPGGLEPQRYADVLAWFLELNGFPEGEAELGTEEERLLRIRVSDPPGGR